MFKSLPCTLRAAAAAVICAFTSVANSAPQYSATLLPEFFDYKDLNDRGDVLVEVVQQREEWGPIINAGIYSPSGLQVLPRIGDAAAPLAINNRRDVAGYFFFVGSRESPFVWSNNQFQAMPDEVALFTDINDSGVAVGINSPPGPFFWSMVFPANPTVDQDLGYLRGPLAINEAGHMAGFMADDPGLPSRAFLYADRKLTDLGTLDGSMEGTSVARALNDHDEVTGFSSTGGDGSPNHAFLYSAGRLRDIGALGDDAFSEGLDINIAGDVVGISGALQEDLRTAFLYSQGTLYDLNRLVRDLPDGAHLTTAIAINEEGVILAKGCEPFDERCQGFLLTPLQAPVPVPEPGLPALLVVGFSALIISRHRGRRHVLA